MTYSQNAEQSAPAITHELARFISGHPGRGWDDSVDHEAHRTLYNWLGCAIGAAGHETADSVVAAVSMLEPAAQASIFGRREKFDMANAALINGITSHTFDFDDTHLKTIIHPAGPVASAVMALAEFLGSSGRAVIDALVVGIDVSCRMGNVMYPEHYDRGWHITGSTGTLGAAAGAARLLGLDERRTAMALGIAASQPVGLREQFGTMTKPFHPGGAAKAGLMSALLAGKGFTASPRALEAPRGYVQVFSDRRQWNEATDDLGKRFEISFNSYKPFACGIVIHPSIDACVQLKKRGVLPGHLRQANLRVHPLVLELTGKKEPQDGLQSKFSVYHGCAVGLVYGRAGEEEFSDAVVRDPKIVELRRKFHMTIDASVPEDSVVANVVLEDGSSIDLTVEHAIGSLHRPLSDSDLEDKFLHLAGPVLGQAKTAEITKIWPKLGGLDDIRSVISLCRP